MNKRKSNRTRAKKRPPDPIDPNSYLLSKNTRCDLSIDRIIIHIVNKYNLKALEKNRKKLFLEFDPDHFKIKDTWISDDSKKRSKSMYNRIRTITSIGTGKGLSLLYDTNSSFLPPFRFQIDDPDRQIIDKLCLLEEKYFFDYSLSQIEVAFDFNPYNEDFQKFLNKHLYLNYYKGDTWSYAYEDTAPYYIGKKVKNVKSLILYRKVIIKVELLRLEFRLNKQAIEKMNIELPSMNLDQINFRKIVNLKRLNITKLKNYFRRQYKNRRNDFTPEQIESRVRVRCRSILGSLSTVTDIKHKIKNSRHHHHNYNQLFDTIKITNDLFHEKLSNAQKNYSNRN